MKWVFRLIYDFGISCYQFGIFLGSAFHQKAKLIRRGREQTFSILTEKLAQNTDPVAWFHVASLGEFEQGRPVIELFRKAFPSYKIVLTFFSPSGYEVRKNYSEADVICYLPADTPKNAQKFIKLVEPQVIFFVKYEFWHHFITEAYSQNIPLISFSTIFRENQVYFRSYGNFFRSILEKFTHIFVQNENSKNLLQSTGITNITIGGDTRFDRVKAICDNKKNLPMVEKFKDGQKVMVIGSSWEEDLNVIASILDKIQSLKLIIAPHQITESSLQFIEKIFPSKKTARYSQANPEAIKSYDILLIDNIGMLTSLYQYGEWAYVGGAFGKGLHNVLEPAVFGMPVLCGAKYDKFQEVIDLVNLGGVLSCQNTSDFETKFYSLLDDEKRKTVGEICEEYVAKNLGASEQVLHFCQELLN